MRLAFLGTPDAAVPTLNALLEAGHDVVVVVTRPERRRSRRGPLEASPVARAALGHGLEVVHRVADLAGVDVERGVVVAYGALIPAAVLERVPMLNVHFSLLPRWRGAAPVQRAILAGDLETGVSIISLEATLDTGPVHLERRVPVDEKRADELVDELALVGAAALVEVLASPSLLLGAYPQVGEATYAEKITRESVRLTPAMTVTAASRTVRVGGAYLDAEGRRLTVESTSPTSVEVAPGSMRRVEGQILLGLVDGGLVLERVRPEGARSMDAPAWWHGLRPARESRTWSEGK